MYASSCRAKQQRSARAVQYHQTTWLTTWPCTALINVEQRTSATATAALHLSQLGLLSSHCRGSQQYTKMSLSSRTNMLLRCHAHRQLQLLFDSAGPRQYSSGSDCQQQDKILLKGMVFHGYHGALPEVLHAACSNGTREAGSLLSSCGTSCSMSVFSCRAGSEMAWLHMTSRDHIRHTCVADAAALASTHSLEQKVLYRSNV